MDAKISGEEMELLEKKQNLDDMLKERRNAKVEEEREKATARGGVTRQVVARSRASETVVELLSADVDGRRNAKDTTLCMK